MSQKLKYLNLKVKIILILLVISGVIVGGKVILAAKTKKLNEVSINLSENGASGEKLAIVQENSILPTFKHNNPPPKTVRTMNVIVTAYSSSTFETDDNPYITAAGTQVREGIVANNYLPFGTKIRIPEIYGDKIFVVEDRMNWKKGYYHVDIWFPSYWEAKSFGAKRTQVEILEG